MTRRKGTERDDDDDDKDRRDIISCVLYGVHTVCIWARTPARYVLRKLVEYYITTK